MKITIEHEDVTVSVEEEKAVTIDEFMENIKCALLAVGFSEKTIKPWFYEE